MVLAYKNVNEVNRSLAESSIIPEFAFSACEMMRPSPPPHADTAILNNTICSHMEIS
jgi:hypothetical protein